MSCFESPDNQLYLLELTVVSLQLTPEKLYECDKRPLLVKLKYLDLPIFILSPSDFEPMSQFPNDAKNGMMLFSSGRSCLFGKRPGSLVREMQITPLKIGIFCTDETYPIAEASLQISGCMCDQISMSMNDKDHLPKPFTMAGEYGLIDPGDNPSGKINLSVKITCLGKYITTHYQLRENAFVFKSDRDEGQFFVKPLLPGDDEASKPKESPPQGVNIEGIDDKTDENMQKSGKKEKKSKKKKKK